MEGIVPSLPIEGVAFVLGNDLDGIRVCVKPVVSEKPCEVPGDTSLEGKHPESFTACVVPRAHACAVEKGNSSKHNELSGGLADTFFARLVYVSPCSRFFQEALLSEQENNPSLAPFRETTDSAKDLKGVAEGFVLQNGVW